MRHLVSREHKILRKVIWPWNDQSGEFRDRQGMTPDLGDDSLEHGQSKAYAMIVMRRITTFRSTTDRIYDGGPIMIIPLCYNCLRTWRMDSVEKDLQIIGFRNCRRESLNRDQWRAILEEAGVQDGL